MKAGRDTKCNIAFRTHIPPTNAKHSPKLSQYFRSESSNFLTSTRVLLQQVMVSVDIHTRARDKIRLLLRLDSSEVRILPSILLCIISQCIIQQYTIYISIPHLYKRTQKWKKILHTLNQSAVSSDFCLFNGWSRYYIKKVKVQYNNSIR